MMEMLLANLVRVPALFVFTVGEKGAMVFNTSICTESNVVGLTVLRNHNSIIYSMDTLHRAFSTDLIASTEKGDSRSMVGSLIYCTDTDTWKENEGLQETLTVAMRECAESNLGISQAGVAKGKSVTELLYGLESLRKRGSENEVDT